MPLGRSQRRHAARVVRLLAASAGWLLTALPVGPAPSAGQTPSAVVRGRVAIGIPIATRRPSTAYARVVPRAALAPASELRHVVVYVKNAPPRPVTPVTAVIRQINETFVPRVVAVPVGSTVEFPNDDPFYHNVFSLSRAKTFNLGRYPQGRTAGERFDRPGIVKVFCDIHSHMTATVLVFNHPWFAVPDEDGRFALTDVPPGTREITAWHERLGDTTEPVRVEIGRTAEIDFVLPVPKP
jgi:plastocyanin